MTSESHFVDMDVVNMYASPPPKIMPPSNKGYIALVGNREGVPETSLALFKRLGTYVTNLGYGISSGDAKGVDRAAWNGAKESHRYQTVGARIYLADFEGYRAERALRDNNFIDGSTLTEVEATARAILEELIPHFTKMSPYIQRLFIRNVYQILGSDLKTPVKALFYYSEPVGDLSDECVKGGTNVALQIAKRFNVPHRINLYGMEEATLANLLLTLEFDTPPALDLYTIQMGKWRDLKDTGIQLVDVTLKSGNRAFSPDVNLLRDYKSGVINDVEYTERFDKLMLESLIVNRPEWLGLLTKGRIALACYCGKEHFCHRNLLSGYIKDLGVSMNVTVNLKGEYIKG